MQLPFTVDQFMAVFVAYNAAIWPMQIVLNLLALVAILLCFRAVVPSRIIAATLTVLWLWSGVVYHLMFFHEINPAAIVFAMLFIIAASIFFYEGVIKQNLHFQVSKSWSTYIGALFLFYGLILYPLIGNALGHPYPSSPTFGVPCPTTIFTFGLLLWTRGRVKWYVYFIPLLWSLIGFMAATDLGIREDIGLLVAGVVGAFMLSSRSRVARGEA